MSSSTSAEEDVVKAQNLIERLATEETRSSLVKARIEVLDCQRKILLESGEVHLRIAKGEEVDPARKKLLNQCLNLIECYLTSLECALSKVDFLQIVLNPASDTASVQSQIPYQTMLEQLMAVQAINANRLINAEPTLTTLVTPTLFDKNMGILLPFRQMCTITINRV